MYTFDLSASPLIPSLWGSTWPVTFYVLQRNFQHTSSVPSFPVQFSLCQHFHSVSIFRKCVLNRIIADGPLFHSFHFDWFPLVFHVNGSPKGKKTHLRAQSTILN